MVSSEMFKYVPDVHDPIIDSVFKEWDDNAMYGVTASEEELTQRFGWLYEWLGFEKPQVVLCDGILEAQLMANMVRHLTTEDDKLGDKLRYKLDAKLDDKLYAELDAKLDDKLYAELDAKLDDKLYDKLRAKLRDKLYDKLDDKLDAKLYAELDAKLDDKLDAKLRAKLRDKLYDKLDDKLGDKQLEYFTPFLSPSQYGSIGYYSFFDAAQRIIKTKISGQKELKELIHAGALMPLCFDGLVICSKKPTIVLRDADDDLHSETQAAVQFENGEAYHFVHGVSFTEEQFETLILRKPSSNEVLGIDNVELRMAVLEVHGYDILLSEATVIERYDTFQKTGKGRCVTEGTTFIRAGNVRQGDVLLVYEGEVSLTCPHCGGVSKEVIDKSLSVSYALYIMNDASLPFKLLRGEWWEKGQKRSFVETVPRESQTCREAVARSFQINEDEYWDRLVRET